MSKPPSHRSIVREIRLALGLTQEALADRLAVYLLTIRRIENGTLPISQHLAQQLANLSGVNRSDIVANRPGPLETRSKRGVTPRRLLDLDRKARALDARARASMLDDYLYRLELLFDAVMVQEPHQIWVLDEAIEQTFSTLEARFKLQETVKKLRSKNLDPKTMAFLARLKLPQELRPQQQRPSAAADAA